MQIPYKNLIRWRNLWLGVAMLWIIFAHSGLKIDSQFLNYLKNWGYGGVDICLFASGLGCYFSLNKDPDTLRFLKRRLLRLAPTYIPFMLVWCVYRRLTHGPYPLTAVAGNLLGIQDLTGLGNSFNWYISAILLFYLLAPLFKDLADRLSPTKQALFLGVLLLISVPFWRADGYIITLTRLPIFYCGMLLARWCREEKVLTAKPLLACLLAMVLGFGLLHYCYNHFESILWSHGLHWYPFLLITPGLCITLSLVAGATEKLRFSPLLTKPLEAIGKCSFELYLVHIPIFEFLRPRVKELPYDRNLLWLGIFLLTALSCVILKTFARQVTRLFR